VWSYRNRHAVFIASERDEPIATSDTIDALLQQASDDSLLETLLQVVHDRPELAEYIRAASLFEKRSEIADHLEVDVAEVTNRQKRVRRIFANALPEFLSQHQIINK
jgi:hypothetical protein